MTSDNLRLIVRAALLAIPVAVVVLLGYREEKKGR